MNFYQNKTKTQLQGLEEMPVVTEELQEMSDEEMEKVCGGERVGINYNVGINTLLLTASFEVTVPTVFEVTVPPIDVTF